MQNIFIVLGYGIPKNIFKDNNYNFYLNLVFNQIYNINIKNKNDNSLIIFCGGKTDMLKPYQRNEADEMIKFFKVLSQRPAVKMTTKNWSLIAEKKSLSTLENLLNAKNIIIRKKIKLANLFIFCEQTRGDRIKKISSKIFNGGFKIKVVPFDFDVSSNRYLSPEFISKKEIMELRHSLWALKDIKNLKKHHQLFIDKMNYLRQAGTNHPEAVKDWWEKKLDCLYFDK